MNRYRLYIICCIAFNLAVKGQIIFLNNPSNHIVAFNPAFSAIKPGNNNYAARQLCTSSRISKEQTDILTTAQVFLRNTNIGLSADYGLVSQNKSLLQKGGIGLSYHLLFFDAISTGWGIGVSYTDLHSSAPTLLNMYGEKKDLYVQNSKYAALNFGWMFNYENMIGGLSIQPKQTVWFNSAQKTSFYTTATAYFKYRYALTRNINASLWYTGNFNTVDNLIASDSATVSKKIQSHALNIHVSGKKGLIGGIGGRVANFNYASMILKAGYNFRYIQLLYGIEPYWLHAKYSTLIHEISITLKFK
ncbi:MAG: hypothetical protein V4506_01055 [Bacteroidota bacterium]